MITKEYCLLCVRDTIYVIQLMYRVFCVFHNENEKYFFSVKQVNKQLAINKCVYMCFPIKFKLILLTQN